MKENLGIYGNDIPKLYKKSLTDMTTKIFLLNLNNKRNKNNVSTYDYNCGGYALGTYTWYRPVDDYDTDYDYVFGSWDMINDDEWLDRATDECVEFMLKDFIGNLRVIKTTSELQENEYAIAFRIGGEDNDFHYAKRGKNGHWYHKQGGCPIRKIKKEKVFAPVWDFGRICYCGRLVLLAKKY